MLEVGPGGTGCLKGVGGTVILLGKPGEAMSPVLQVDCHDSVQMGMASRGGARTGQQPEPVTSLGHGFSLHYPVGLSCTLVWGVLFGVYILWHFPPPSQPLPDFPQSCVDDRRILDRRQPCREYPLSQSPCLSLSPAVKWVQFEHSEGWPPLNHCLSQISSPHSCFFRS